MFEEEQVASYVSLKLSNNPLPSSDNYVARVPRDTVSVNGVVSEIIAGYPSIDPYVILHSLELVKAKTLELLQQGRSVDIMELGTMYIKPTGTVTKDNPQVSDLPSLTLAFTPSTSAKEALSKVTANSFMISDTAPQIQLIYDLRLKSDETISAGNPVKVTGAKLKLALNDDGTYATGNGVYFAPLSSDGGMETDTSKWIEVTDTSIYTNYPKTLEFFVPSGLTTGSEYYVVIRTTYVGKDEVRQEYVEGASLYSVIVQ